MMALLGAYSGLTLRISQSVNPQRDTTTVSVPAKTEIPSSPDAVFQATRTRSWPSTWTTSTQPPSRTSRSPSVTLLAGTERTSGGGGKAGWGRRRRGWLRENMQ